jgi:hypothetical protein
VAKSRGSFDWLIEEQKWFREHGATEQIDDSDYQ